MKKLESYLWKIMKIILSELNSLLKFMLNQNWKIKSKVLRKIKNLIWIKMNLILNNNFVMNFFLPKKMLMNNQDFLWGKVLLEGTMIKARIWCLIITIINLDLVKQKIVYLKTQRLNLIWCKKSSLYKQYILIIVTTWHYIRNISQLI